MSRSVSRNLLVVALLSAGLALVLALNGFPILRGGYGWRWPYEAAALPRVLLVALAVGVYVAGAMVLLRRESPARLLLAWSVAATVVLSLAGIALRHDDPGMELFTRTFSGVTTGQLMVAAEIERSPGWSPEVVGDWPDYMRDFQGRAAHISVAGPGLVIGYAAAIGLVDAVPGLAEPLARSVMPYQCHNTNLLAYSPAAWGSAWLGMLMPLWTGLCALVVYGAVRAVSGRQAARYAVLWWPLVPGLVMFVASPSTLYPAASLVMLWLLVAGLRSEGTRRAVGLAGAGLVLGLLTVANYAFGPVVLLAGMVTLARFSLVERRRDPVLPWARPVIAGAWFGIGLVLPWLALWAGVGMSPFAVWEASQEVHLSFDRPYIPWVMLHPWDWMMFVGLSLVLVWLVSVGQWLRDRQSEPPVIGLSLLITVVVLALSGTTRGESGRTWMALSGFAVLAASGALARWSEGAPGRVQGRMWAIVTMGQVALLLVMMGTWNVIGSEMAAPPVPERAVTDQVVDVRAGDDLRLVGWGAEVVTDGETGEPVIALSLNWQPDRRALVPYFLAALLVNPSGAASGEAVVVQPDIPLTCYAPGKVAGTVIRLPLPEGAESGAWWISLSVLGDDRSDYQPVALRTPDGGTDSQIGLGPVMVP